MHRRRCIKHQASIKKMAAAATVPVPIFKTNPRDVGSALGSRLRNRGQHAIKTAEATDIGEVGEGRDAVDPVVGVLRHRHHTQVLCTREDPPFLRPFVPCLFSREPPTSHPSLDRRHLAHPDSSTACSTGPRGSASPDAARRRTLPGAFAPVSMRHAQFPFFASFFASFSSF